jgi:hypothetical protein
VAINYLLGANTTGPVTLELIDTTSGQTIRRYSSDDPDDPPVPMRNIPDYWIRPTPRLQATPGLHRFVWDVRFAPPAVDTFTYPIAAVIRNTPKTPQGMWVTPGTYQVRLTVGGRAYRQAVVVKMDPRVRMSAVDLALQFRLSKSLNDMMRQLKEAQAALTSRLAAAAGDEAVKLRSAAGLLAAASAPLPDLFSTIQDVDARPTVTTEAAATAALKAGEAALAAARVFGIQH